MGFLRCRHYGSHPKLPNVFSLQSLDSWGTSEDADAPAKRRSTSDLSDATFSDIRREGWLSYKQILTKKGKVRWPEEGG